MHWEQRSPSDDSDDSPYLAARANSIASASELAESSSSSAAATPALLRRTQSVERQGGLSYAEIERSGPPAQPLEFPAPAVYRGARITVNGCDHRTGKFHRVKNVLVRLPERGGSRGRRRTIPHVPNRGYCIRRKICDTVYGSVRLCVVMKRRISFLHETHTGVGGAEGARSEPRHFPEKKRGGSLESIGEDDDDWAEASLEAPPGHYEDGDDVVWESTDELVVVKVVSWSKVQSKRGKHLEDPVKEVAAMQLIGGYHPNVVGSLEVLRDSGHLYSITPYCDGGDLYSLTLNEFEANGTGRLDEAQARHWFRQILQGLNHLQKKGVCHRDISLENILVHQNRCAIIDFGLALRVPYSDPFNEGCIADVSAGTTRHLIRAQGQGGHWIYMAPEVVNREAFDGFAIDLWAAGVALYIMLVGLSPFRWAHESDRRFQKFSTGGLKETLRYWDIPLSDAACDLLQNMFWRDPRRRLTLAQVVEHPWVAQQSSGEKREEICVDVFKRDSVTQPAKEQVSTYINRKVAERKAEESSVSEPYGTKESPEKRGATSAGAGAKFTSSKLQHLFRGKTKAETRQGSF